MAEVSKRAAQVRKKQLLILGGVGCAIAALSIVASIWLQPAQKNAKQVVQPKTMPIILGGSATDKEAWRVQSSAEFDKMNKRLKDLEKRETERLSQLEKLEKDERDRANQLQSYGAVVTPPPPPESPVNSGNLFTQVGSGGAQVVPPPTRSGTSDAKAEPVTNEVPVPRIRSITTDDIGDGDQTQTEKNERVHSARKFGHDERRKRSDKYDVSEGKDRYTDEDPISYNRAGGRTADTYLPAGTFARATLLNGLDAPTGGQSQQNPHPVLLMVSDNAQLPNGMKTSLKGCVVTGSGHGDLSAERAYVRIDRLSCVDEEGGAIDVAVRGYVSGEDGKTGLRGRLVTKSGQVIANALLTGVLSGFGESLRQSSVSTATAPVTGVQTQTVNNALEYGIGTGVGKAMDRVSQYYIKLADKIFPIVEVDGGRVVDIVITRGVSIERK